jgi:hypothetical protein
MKAMTVVRACLAVVAAGTVVLVLASAWPSFDFRGLAVIAVLLLIAAIVASTGAVARGWLAQATHVDITWPLLLLSLLVFGIFWSGALLPPNPGGCYTVERASEMKSIGFKLWVAWSVLACLGLGAAISKNDSLPRVAIFIFPLAIIVIFVALLGLALGDPIYC